MLLRLCELKDFCLEFQETMPELLITISNWNKIEDMVQIVIYNKILLNLKLFSTFRVGYIETYKLYYNYNYYNYYLFYYSL